MTLCEIEINNMPTTCTTFRLIAKILLIETLETDIPLICLNKTFRPSTFYTLLLRLESIESFMAHPSRNSIIIGWRIMRVIIKLGLVDFIL